MKHKEIKGSDNCVTLNISENSDSLNKMETTSSESKVELWRSEKGLVTALALKTKAGSKNTKRQGMPSKMSVRRTFPTKSKSLKNCQGTLFEKDPQTWTHFELFLGVLFKGGTLTILLNILILLERSFILTFLMAYLAFLYFSTLLWSWDPERLPNPFLISPNFPFDSEDVVSILFRLSNLFEIFKVTHLSLPLISLCFLTLWRPQFFIFTDWNKSCLPVKFSSHNVFRVEQPWWIDSGVATSFHLEQYFFHLNRQFSCFLKFQTGWVESQLNLV